jgi:hypothetical protein
MMTSENPPNERFDRFLAWLHPDRDLAGEKYEVIRSGLMRYFARHACHGDFNCPHADELTGETIDRVVSKMDEVTDKYPVPERRIFTFATYVRKEHLRELATEPIKPDISNKPDIRREEAKEKERQIHCLGRCLGRLPEKDRYLITEYFQYSGQERIDRRRELAAELDITRNYLAVTALRLRNVLHKCLLECLQKISVSDVIDP